MTTIRASVRSSSAKVVPRAERLGKEKALPEFAAERHQAFPLAERFHPLGNDAETEGRRKIDDRADNLHVRSARAHAVHEGAVHLDRLKRKPRQVAQPGIPGAEVVDMKLHLESAQLLESR